MQGYDYSGIIYVILAAVAFLAIKLATDYISSSRHYVIDFEKKSETNGRSKLSADYLMKIIEKAQEISDAKRATKGLPVLIDELNFNQENNKATFTMDEVDYGLNQLSGAGKIIRYKNLVAVAKNGAESISAYYIYELAMNENSNQIDGDYKKMLKANDIMTFQELEKSEKDARTIKDTDTSIVTLGVKQTNSLRKKMYSYDTEGGYLLFLLSNGMMKCIEA
jgi:hypothetical protein